MSVIFGVIYNLCEIKLDLQESLHEKQNFQVVKPKIKYLKQQ